MPSVLDHSSDRTSSYMKIDKITQYFELFSFLVSSSAAKLWTSVARNISVSNITKYHQRLEIESTALIEVAVAVVFF